VSGLGWLVTRQFRPRDPASISKLAGQHWDQ
jgi:hypothetical protein